MGSPPTGVQEWDFSFAATLARQTGVNKFRWRLNGDEWLCDRIVGVCDVDSVSTKGHVTVRGKLQIARENGQDVAYLWPDGDVEIEGEIEGTKLPTSHWRLCANLQGDDEHKWRLRNEKTQEYTEVRGYRGRSELNWMDGGTHVFHDGEVIIDKDNVAHLK